MKTCAIFSYYKHIYPHIHHLALAVCCICCRFLRMNSWSIVYPHPQEVTSTLYWVFTIPMQVSILLLHISVWISVTCFQHYLPYYCAYIYTTSPYHMLCIYPCWQFNCTFFVFTYVRIICSSTDEHSVASSFSITNTTVFLYISLCIHLLSIRHRLISGSGRSRNMYISNFIDNLAKLLSQVTELVSLWQHL